MPCPKYEKIDLNSKHPTPFLVFSEKSIPFLEVSARRLRRLTLQEASQALSGADNSKI